MGVEPWPAARRGSIAVPPALRISTPEPPSLSAQLQIRVHHSWVGEVRATAAGAVQIVTVRAREKLILSGCIGVRKDGVIGTLGGWLGRLAGEAELRAPGFTDGISGKCILLGTSLDPVCV